MAAFSEDTYEQALIELFQSLEGKQYRYEYGPDLVRDYTNPILDDVLQESLHRINPSPRHPSRHPSSKTHVW